MSIMLVDIRSTVSIASVAGFFETTWFVWWFVAVTFLARWCLNIYFENGDLEQAEAKGWRSLYESALHESDSAKAAILIEEAEAAILQKLAAQLFDEDRSERAALQDAMKNLRDLRGNLSQTSDNARIA